MRTPRSPFSVPTLALLVALVALVALAAACSGKVVPGEAGGGGTAGTGAAGAAGGGEGGSGVGVVDPGPYEAFCQAQTACKPSFDQAACEASAACDSLLLHHPGGPLFECLLDECGVGSCVLSVYSDHAMEPHTAAAQAFQDGCVNALNEGCPVFEDFCLAGALFTDEALVTLTACFDLPTCDELKACALQTYAPCTAWLYNAPVEP